MAGKLGVHRRNALSFSLSLSLPSHQTLDLINFISLTEFGHIYIYKSWTEYFISADYFNLMSPPPHNEWKFARTVNLYASRVTDNYINRFTFRPFKLFNPCCSCGIWVLEFYRNSNSCGIEINIGMTLISNR